MENGEYNLSCRYSGPSWRLTRRSRQHTDIPETTGEEVQRASGTGAVWELCRCLHTSSEMAEGDQRVAGQERGLGWSYRRESDYTELKPLPREQKHIDGEKEENWKAEVPPPEGGGALPPPRPTEK